MSEHVADIAWERETESFAYDDYNRTHVWRFDNGLEIAAAAAPAGACSGAGRGPCLAH